MGETGAQRRLAVIVAIDVAGYSARTLADEATSAAEIAALRLRIESACARFGGRLFNAAGDGFMLEFPTASGALGAAEALVSTPDPPIRIGVHLGEVQVTPTGDLLGHGVNVAARIQALASPGSVLVSGDIRQAIRGGLGRGLVAHGAVRLGKIDETVKIFETGKVGAASRTRLAWRRFRTPLAAVALAGLIVAGGAWLWRAHVGASTEAQARVAVLPFDAQSRDAATRAAADGIADEMTTVLSGAQFLIVGADQTASLRGASRNAAMARLGVAFVLDGSVVREGEALKAHVRLDDARGGMTIWSDSFSGLASDPAVLETNVASTAADMATFARFARLGPGGNVDDAALAGYLKASAYILEGRDNAPLQARVVLQQVVRQARWFARAHGALALEDGLLSRSAPPEQHDALVREAREEAATALVLDPHSAEPYLALYEIPPARAWAQRERVMLQGLSVEPNFPYLVSTQSVFLANVGRTQEALAAAQKALAANALHPRTNARYAVALTNAGRFGAARAAADQTVRVLPAGWTDLARLSMVMLYGSARDARSLLDVSSAHPYPGEAPALSAWSAYLKARESGRPRDRAEAIAALKTGVRRGDLPAEDVIPILCALGDRDDAFALLDTVERGLETIRLDFLYAPATAPLRSDPRFWTFTAKAGLARYWQDTGRWPDICQRPDALADCRAKVSAALAAERT